MQPEKVRPLDPREFAFALQVGSAAFSGRMPVHSPIGREFLVEDTNGEVKGIALDDTRFNRAALAILDQFAPDFEKFQSVMLRYLALLRLTRLEEMRKWQKAVCGGNDVAMHPAVLIAAATLPLAKGGAFDEFEFFRRVEELAAGGDRAATTPVPRGPRD
ncbi:MAG: hypothetical protein HY315_04580 [Acidobacteria bacterium]|nr:hypothetical protein [Acidobacteriota bacterium]